MESTKPDTTIDPTSGYCSKTKIFHSHRPKTPVPSSCQPLSISQFTFSLLLNSTKTKPLDFSTTKVLINSTTGDSLTYSDFIHRVHSLSHSISTRFPSLKKNDVAFILSPSSFHIPVIYFSLLSLGVVMSPANPLSSESEVAHQLRLCNPKLAFATSATAGKIKSASRNESLEMVLIDSPEFQSFLNFRRDDSANGEWPVVDQSDIAAVLYSSGTTGRVKGVGLTHRNLIALISGFYNIRSGADAAVDGDGKPVPEPHPVSLFTLPLFHVFGFFILLRAVAMGETVVLMDLFNFEEMLRAVERYRVTYMPVSPPLIVAFVKSEFTKKYDLSSLLLIGSGGAPLGKEVADRFKEKFPNVEIRQGYGMTETTGAATGMAGPEENKVVGSAGRLAADMEAKIVDPGTGEALGPGQRGELWLRGPIVMKGYVGDDKATAETLDSDGWLKTGDLCYFDSDGFLFIVDRLKELIKYKAYQVPPAELEELLQSKPEIADAAVIPYPDEEAGQIPMAYIVRKPGSHITEAQVMDFVAKKVAPYKKIRQVAFINAIPKSPAGKILRRELMNHALTATSSKL